MNYGSYNDDVIRICNSRELESKRYAKMQCVCVYEENSINTKICWFSLNNQCRGCRCEREATEIHFMWFGIWYAVSVKQFQKSFKFSLIHSYPRGAARGSFFYMPCIFQLESACGMIFCGLLLLNISKLYCNGRLFNRHQKKRTKTASTQSAFCFYIHMYVSLKLNEIATLSIWLRRAFTI